MMNRLIWRNFAVSVWIWIVWWMALFAQTVARTGMVLGPDPLHDPGVVYLLLVVVQLLLWFAVYLRWKQIGQIFAGVLGGMPLVILGALWLKSIERHRPIACLTPANVVLLTYIGLSHLAFAAFNGTNTHGR